MTAEVTPDRPSACDRPVCDRTSVSSHDSELDLEPPGCAVLVVGCGNLLRGDDGVGPVLIRHLWDRGVPDGARLVDGGTAGMDVGFQMRGAQRVVIVDACVSQDSDGDQGAAAAPGTVYRLPGEELTDLPPLQGLHTHSFRWDHAIPFARWALGDACPTDITVYLIEVAAMEMGAELSDPVAAAMEQVIAMIEADFLAPLRPQTAVEASVELSEDGYLRMAAALAAGRFPVRCAGGGSPRRRTVAVPTARAQQRWPAAQTAEPGRRPCCAGA